MHFTHYIIGFYLYSFVVSAGPYLSRLSSISGSKYNGRSFDEYYAECRKDSFTFINCSESEETSLRLLDRALSIYRRSFEKISLIDVNHKYRTKLMIDTEEPVDEYTKTLNEITIIDKHLNILCNLLKSTDKDFCKFSPASLELVVKDGRELLDVWVHDIEPRWKNAFSYFDKRCTLVDATMVEMQRVYSRILPYLPRSYPRFLPTRLIENKTDPLNVATRFGRWLLFAETIGIKGGFNLDEIPVLMRKLESIAKQRRFKYLRNFINKLSRRKVTMRFYRRLNKDRSWINRKLSS